jgi:hypothetical protein
VGSCSLSQEASTRINSNRTEEPDDRQPTQWSYASVGQSSVNIHEPTTTLSSSTKSGAIEYLFADLDRAALISQISDEVVKKLFLLYCLKMYLAMKFRRPCPQLVEKTQLRGYSYRRLLHHRQLATSENRAVCLLLNAIRSVTRYETDSL